LYEYKDKIFPGVYPDVFFKGAEMTENDKSDLEELTYGFIRKSNKF